MCRRSFALVALALTALGVVVPPAALADPAASVVIHVFQFAPASIAVTRGARVTWVNRDAIEHTVTAGTPDAPGGRFDARLPSAGASATVQFDERGAQPYFCARHPSMRGEVRVD